MARITQVSDTAADSEAAILFTAIRGKIGMVPNLYRVAANQPKVLTAMLGLNDTLAGGTFDARTREAIALAVAGANACDYCASAHAAISKGLKVDADEIEARLAGRSADPALDAALRFARRVVEARGFVTDDDLAAVRRAGHGDGEIVELVALVAMNILTNYINHVAQTAIDFPAVDASAHRVAA